MPSILITGCSSGIGHHCAHALRNRGWRVFATARDSADVARLEAEGLEALQLDVTDSLSIETAVSTILQRTHGTLDALFNNAGYGQPGAVEDLPREAMKLQFDTNVFGPLELTNRLLPVMRKQGHGRIVFNSSVLGYAAMRMRGAYNSSKFALEGLADTLRLELYGSGIDVVLIEPGPIESNFRSNCIPHYRRWINLDKSPHWAMYTAMEARLEHEGPAAPFTLPASAVFDKLVHALESRRPRPRYPITVPAILFAWAKRFLSTRMLDKMLLAATKSDGPRKRRSRR